MLSCLLSYLNGSFLQPLIRLELKRSQKPWNVTEMKDGRGCSMFSAADFVHEFLIELNGGLNLSMIKISGSHCITVFSVMGTCAKVWFSATWLLRSSRVNFHGLSSLG